MKRRTALHACDLRVAFPVLKRAVEGAALGSGHHPDFAAHLGEGEAYVRAMLRDAHGEAGDWRCLPTLAQLAQWRHRANVAIGIVDREDGTWLQAYIASQPVPDQRLLVSCLIAGRAELSQ